MLQVPNPRITVVLAVRNGEKYIAESIKSILMQTYGDFRFLIVDDNSTDRTTSIVREFTDKRIDLVLNKYPPGRCGAMNFAYELADSDFIANMDSDDIAMPERFERQVHFMDNNPSVGVLGTYFIKFLENNPSERTLQKHPLSHAGCKEQLLSGSTCFGNPTTLIRRSSIPIGLNFRDRFWCTEDYKFFSEISVQTKLANIPYTGLYYRVHDKSVSYIHLKEQIEQCRIIQLELIEKMFNPAFTSDEAETLRAIINKNSPVDLASICRIYAKLSKLVSNINWLDHKKYFLKNAINNGMVTFNFDSNIDFRSYIEFIRYRIKYHFLRRIKRK